MAKVILDNRSNERFDISLYHHLYCRHRGECACMNMKVIGPTGKLMVQKLPASISLGPHEKSEALDSAVLHIPQVKERIRRRKLIRIDLPSADLPPTATSGPPVTSGAPKAPGRVTMLPAKGPARKAAKKSGAGARKTGKAKRTGKR